MGQTAKLTRCDLGPVDAEMKIDGLNELSGNPLRSVEQAASYIAASAGEKDKSYRAGFARMAQWLGRQGQL